MTTATKTKTKRPELVRTPRTEEGTPIYAALLKAHGDPVVRPAKDRSFATLSRMAELDRTKK